MKNIAIVYISTKCLYMHSYRYVIEYVYTNGFTRCKMVFTKLKTKKQDGIYEIKTFYKYKRLFDYIYDEDMIYFESRTDINKLLI